MSLDEGVYWIRSLGADNSFVGAGPVPLIFPPPASPLRCVPETIKDPIGIKPKGDGKYILGQKRVNYGIGYDEEGRVKLINDSKIVKWVIDRGNDEGHFRIKTPDSNKYWTAPENIMEFITLQNENGDLKQEWSFEKVPDP